MKITLILIATILGIAVAIPVEKDLEQNGVARNSQIEQMIIDALEEFRLLMQTGDESTPVLDPFKLDELHLDLSDLGLPGSHLTAGEVEARHLSTFVLDEVSANLNSLFPPRYRIILDGHIEVLEVDAGKYDLNVNAMGVNLFGNGDAKMKIIEPRIRANIVANIGLGAGITIALHSAHVTFKLKAFEPDLSGMFGGNEITNDFVNLFLAYLVPEMVEFYEEEISEILSNLIMEIGSDLLPMLKVSHMRQDLTVAAMLPLLESNGGQISTALGEAGLQENK